MHPCPLEGGTPAAAALRPLMRRGRRHAVLDRLEREAILDLQLEPFGLLTERSHLACRQDVRERRRMACSVGDGGG